MTARPPGPRTSGGHRNGLPPAAPYRHDAAGRQALARARDRLRAVREAVAARAGSGQLAVLPDYPCCPVHCPRSPHGYHGEPCPRTGCGPLEP